MKKFWVVYGVKNAGTFKEHNAYEEAAKEAKRLQADNRGNVYFILEAVGVTEDPVPDIKIVELKGV